MKVPPFLRKNDTVAIAAPARKISKEEIFFAEQWLKQNGFNVFYDERLFAYCNQFAGNDNQRAEYLQYLIDNDDVKAIWCARGGYGSARIIDLLDFDKFSKKPKWICGYSDITVFHSHIAQNLDIATLHCTMPINIQDENTDNEANNSFLDALCGNALSYKIAPDYLSRTGEFSGQLIGGNLSVLYSLLGSPSDIDTDGKVLLIEDLDEYLYHIDRMMLNLKRNGKLKNLKALLVGHLSQMHDNTIPFGKNAMEIVSDYCKEYDYPVIFNVPVGHLPDNRALRMGCETIGFFEDNNFIIKNLTR